MSAKNDVLRAQRRWAAAAGCKVDSRGYVARLADNLRRASPSVAAFERPGSSELAPGLTRPPRLFALHSSAALVLNVFEHWTDRPRAPLLQALGTAGTCTALKFEQPFATGLEGDPPYIDVVLEIDERRLVAIESKFTEWLAPRPPNGGRFKPKYFAGGTRHWAARGLPRCQQLAEDVQRGAARFKHLHAAQLLKHALALAAARGTAGWTLEYLYFDVEGRESQVHTAEIERFAARAEGEIAFVATSYQEVYARLKDDPRVDAGYLDYLRARYFPARRGA